MGIESVLRSIAIELAPTPADAVSRARHRQRPRRAQPRDEGAGQRRAAGEDEAGRDLHQHRARGSRGLRGARGGRQGPRAARRPRRLRERAGDARRRRSRTISSALPGVYGTHHIGASTDQAQEAIAAETVRIIRSYKETGRVPNVVNLARRTPATHMLVVRHRDRPGVLAHVFNHLRAGQPERAGDGEHRLRRRRSRRRAHQPRRRAAGSRSVRRSKARTPTSSICSS